MTDPGRRRVSTLRTLKGLEDLKLAQISQQQQRRQAASQALQGEIDALETRVDHEIETADAAAASFVPVFVRAAQKAAGDLRTSQSRLDDESKRSEAELRDLYRRVTALRLAADVVAAKEMAAERRHLEAQSLEGMITRHATAARNDS